VTPSYNQAQYLERTILSVVSQAYPNLEYIVIDGASTDGSVEILRHYASKLAYWVSERDHGQSDALRKGFAIGTGELMGWVNADDTYLPGAFETVAREFLEHRDADLVFGNYYWIDKDDRRIAEVRHTKFDLKCFLYLGGTIHQSAAFWTRDAYRRAGGVDVSMEWSMDADLLARIAERGNVRHVRRHLANFRQHEAAKTYRGLEGQVREWQDRIRPRYLPTEESRVRVRAMQVKCQLARAWRYCLQGDGSYVLKGILKRLRKLLQAQP
jgi:glycosyltransferase involved in cell wall biosynthesis